MQHLRQRNDEKATRSDRSFSFQRILEVAEKLVDGAIIKDGKIVVRQNEKLKVTNHLKCILELLDNE